jgi:hypothetical protein
MKSNTLPLAVTTALADVETGIKLDEDRCREPLGEDVDVLRCRGHMKDVDSTDGDTFPDKVEVNHNMLGTLMLHRVGGEVDGTDVVAVDQSGPRRRRLELLEKLAESGDLGDHVGDGAVLSLGARAGDHMLTLGEP